MVPHILNRCSRWQLYIGRNISPVPTEWEFESATDSVWAHRRRRYLILFEGCSTLKTNAPRSLKNRTTMCGATRRNIPEDLNLHDRSY
jgi:hypothetical protein